MAEALASWFPNSNAPESDDPKFMHDALTREIAPMDDGRVSGNLLLACAGGIGNIMRALEVDGMALARRGAAFLYGQGARKVWVFGSVAKGRRLDFRSDIDLAVEGLPPGRHSRVWSELEALLFPRRSDRDRVRRGGAPPAGSYLWNDAAA